MNTRREIPMDGSTLTVQTRWPVRAIAIDNQSNVAVLVTDARGGVYTCQAGQYIQTVIADSINLLARSSIPSSSGQATLYLASDPKELGGSGSSPAPATSGRGNFYDRLTGWEGERGGQAWTTATIQGGALYTVPDGRLAVLMHGWVRWQRTAAPATRRQFTLGINIDDGTAVNRRPVELVIPTWQTRPGAFVKDELTAPVWLPVGGVVSVVGTTDPSGADFGVQADWSYEIAEYVA